MDITVISNFPPQVVRDGVGRGEEGPEDGGGHPGRDPGEEEKAKGGG